MSKLALGVGDTLECPRRGEALPQQDAAGRGQGIYASDMMSGRTSTVAQLISGFCPGCPRWGPVYRPFATLTAIAGAKVPERLTTRHDRGAHPQVFQASSSPH